MKKLILIAALLLLCGGCKSKAEKDVESMTKHRTPLIDQIDSGNWPSFVSNVPHVPDRFTSHAEWPESITLGVNPNVSVDRHQTKEQAHAVCDRLESHGFGGDGEIFPIRTWVEEIQTDMNGVDDE